MLAYQLLERAPHERLVQPPPHDEEEQRADLVDGVVLVPEAQGYDFYPLGALGCRPIRALLLGHCLFIRGPFRLLG